MLVLRGYRVPEKKMLPIGRLPLAVAAHKPFTEVFSNIVARPNTVLYFATYFSTVE